MLALLATILVFVAAGRIFINGGDFYAERIGFAYPPFLAMVAAPFSLLPPLVSRAIWFAASEIRVPPDIA